ncbi:nitroreductase family protein [Parapedobacter sp. ISTM3]|uniref:nitroreductase family protein n=1 Tax=Parapedobacter sp. ISTM3 TaxID=2800130 RepID=UPI00190788B2|nr:nitroreductase family protein [Parapedobacter sp. ISTM3]MBK1439424.1 nitroreductase family protein [Parapedobacter sp. ISTM3]
MSNFLKKMQQRYTVKQYKSDGELPQTVLDELKAILQLSPSSINSQPWKFTFVTDKETKTRLAPFSYHNKQRVLDSSCVVVFQVIKDVAAFEQQIKGHLPEGAVNYYYNMIKPSGDEEISRWLVNQVYIALGVLLSACAQMDIGSTPMEGIEPDKYDGILGDDKYRSLFAVALGVQDENDTNHPDRRPKLRLDREKIVQDI